MSHLNKFNRLSTKALLFSMGLTLVACGGGGGGGGTTYPSIQYSGTTTAATVTENNASDFPITMLEGSTRSDSANTISVVSNNTTTKAQRSTLLMSGTGIIKNVIQTTLSSKSTGASVTGITAPPVSGTCPSPGTATYTVDYSDVAFNGDVTFNNFCIGTQSDSVTVHGKTTFSGTYHLNGPDALFDTLVMEMVYMKISTKTADVVYTEEFSGSFRAVQFDGSIDNNVTNMTFSTSFVADGQSYKVENLSFDTTGGTTLNLSGRFYHPAHGYVDATTTRSFVRVFGNPTKYCDGILLLSADGGTVEFTANIDCSQYNVTFTATGNVSGTPDYDSGMVVWP